MNINLLKTFIFFIAVISFGCKNPKPSKTVTQSGIINVVTPIEFKDKIQNNTLIDIRTPREFEQGHIAGAININLYDKSFLEQIAKYDVSKPIFIYCRSGSRTSSASKKIANLGFTQIYDLQGGISNWYRNKLTIVKE
ncbi:rhodanese-like domain-containing protein [uncultured Lutibacter sp.]|uniref:rhodanese-like domain-containing protein n=1 Tax=uncultured Lutibacter sp. TaxID=437739 RepID=UPI002626FEF4|nr:rhodanese-like domain-containing protein [uncultured Lutibacter sp.]